MTVFRLIAPVMLLAVVVAVRPHPATAETVAANLARLGWLDKITARVGALDVPVGEATQLGVLTITVDSCMRRVPPDAPESAAHMVISEQPSRDAPATPVFKGWMFATSPALSAMDHGVFDVWVLECVTASDRERKNAPPVPGDTPIPDAPPDDGDLLD